MPNSDSIVSQVIKELCDTFDNRERDMQEKSSVKMEYSTSELPVLEQNDSEEELEPLAAVYIKTEVDTDEETEEQEDHLAVYPLSGSKKWDKERHVADSMLLRVQNNEVAEGEAEEDAGISDERTEQAAADVMGNIVEASSSNGTESPSEEHEVSKSENEDILTQTNRHLFAYMHHSGSILYKTTLEELKQKHREERQLLTCDTCQREFTSKKALVIHFRAHINEGKVKPLFSCETCGKEFKNRRNLEVHLRIHTGEKPYVCDHCGKGFNYVSALKVHRRQHTGELPFSCSICNKLFADKSAYVRHTRRHLNIKPFKCKECGKTFVESGAYTIHMRVHTGKRPYKCGFCDKTYAHSTSYRSHEATHTKKYPYNCAVCGKGYCAKGLLVRHLKLHGN